MTAKALTPAHVGGFEANGEPSSVPAIQVRPGDQFVAKPVLVELLANPFCIADSVYGEVGSICRELDVAFRVYNLWEIDDALRGLPSHIASLARDYRTGRRPGTIYSNVFVDGRRVLCDHYPDHFAEIRALIADIRKAALS
jgi:hypothetical protein